MKNTVELLRKKDLHIEVGAPKSTVADWIEEFAVYIPKVKQGNVTYYRPEAIDVLKYIKTCREANYQKPQIMQMIAEKGFPITVEEAVEDVREVLREHDAPRDTLLTVMKMTGQAVAKIADQDEVLKSLQVQQTNQDETLKTLQHQQSDQDERINELTKRTDEITYLKQQIEDLKKELAVTQEEKKKGFFTRLFGK